MRAASLLHEAEEMIQQCADEELKAQNNLPDNLQYSACGCRMYINAEGLGGIGIELSEICEWLESLAGGGDAT